MNAMGKLISLVDSPRKTTFTKWQQDFIASVDVQIEDGSPMTTKQEEMVKKIWEQYFG